MHSDTTNYALDQNLPADLPARLQRRLLQPLPLEAARERFAPALSYRRHFGPPAYDARAAAVLVLLYQKQGAWHVPFTLRPDTMASHAGQISFPGGAVEPGETSQHAAVRELTEEVGVAGERVEIVGSLSPLYVFVSNYVVTPWVAAAQEPVAFRPCRREVAGVIEVPLAELCDPANMGGHRVRRGELEFTAPHFAWREHRIWGATSIILGELVALVDELRLGV